MTFKKAVLGLMIGGLLVPSSVGYTASKGIEVYLGEQKVAMQPMPEVRSSTVYISLGEMAKLLNCPIEWKDAKVYLNTPRGQAVFELDVLSYTFKGKTYPMALPVYAKDNRVMMPLRLVSALLGHGVTYDGAVKINEQPSTEEIGVPEPAYLSTKEKKSYDGKWALINPQGLAYVKNLKDQSYRLLADDLKRELTYAFAQKDKIIYLEPVSDGKGALVVVDLNEMKPQKRMDDVAEFSLDYLSGKVYYAWLGADANGDMQYGMYDLNTKKVTKVSPQVYEDNYKFSSAYSISGTRGAYVDKSEITLWGKSSATTRAIEITSSVLTYFFGGNDKLFYVPYEDKALKRLFVYDFTNGKKGPLFEFVEEHASSKEGVHLFKVPAVGGTWQYKKIDFATGSILDISLEAFENLK